MIKFTEWLKIREMVGTGAIYNGEKAQDSKRDYNWWGAPETAGMSQDQAKAFMNKNIKRSKK